MHDFLDSLDVTSFSPPKLLWIKVFDFLRSAIVRGDIKPGDKIKESVIASKLGISRAPVREAIRILEAENFIETIPQKGSFVKQFTVKEVEELYVVLKALLSSAIQLTTMNLCAENRKELLSIIHDLKQAKGNTDVEVVDTASKRFHNFIINASGNSLLIKIHESFLFHRERTFLLAVNMIPEDLSAIIEGSLTISEAILKCDTEEAERLMKEHMDNARLRMLRALSKKDRTRSIRII